MWSITHTLTKSPLLHKAFTTSLLQLPASITHSFNTYKRFISINQSSTEEQTDDKDAIAQKKAERVARLQRKSESNLEQVRAADALLRERAAAAANAPKRTAAPARVNINEDEVEKVKVKRNDLTGVDVTQQNKFKPALDYLKKIDAPADVIDAMTAIGSYSAASQKDIVSARIENIRKKYGRDPLDTGSPEAQIAILSVRIANYKRHREVHKKDVHFNRTYDITINKRRKLLKYLRRKDFETYAWIMKELNITERELNEYGMSPNVGAAFHRIKR